MNLYQDAPRLRATRARTAHLRRLRCLIAVALLVFCSTSEAFACLWDYDTLLQERQQFPTVLEVLTGKFLRHSTAFYQWRIEDRLKRLEKSPRDLSLYDDLAVAYDKTDNHSAAIDTILKKEAIEPGLYETAANLGTFHIHAGNFEKGLNHIKRAIEINPDAHFGRELYQKLLMEYVSQRRDESGHVKLPVAGTDEVDAIRLRIPPEGATVSGFGFGRYVLSQIGPADDSKTTKAELKKALMGVLGMAHFGQHNSPILLEAIGMILVSDPRQSDAKRLAARAFLKASYSVTEPESRDAYRKLAAAAIQTQSRSRFSPDQIELSAIENQFKKELDEGQSWFQTIECDEAQWIATDADVESMFDKKYRQKPTHSGPSLLTKLGQTNQWLLGALIIAIAACLFVYMRTRRQPNTGA